MLPAEGAELAQFDAVGGVLLVFLGGVIALLAIGASQDNVRASVLSCHCEHLFSECLYLMFPRRGHSPAAGAC